MIKLRLLLLFTLLFLGKNLFAQYEVVKSWSNGADQKDFSFGFTFQYISTDFKIVKKPDWRKPFYDATGTKITDSLSSIGSPPSPGFAVGFYARYNVTEHFEGRVTPM